MKIYVTIGGSVACFFLSWLSFSGHQAGLGWLFLLVGLIIVVLGLFAGGKKQ